MRWLAGGSGGDDGKACLQWHVDETGQVGQLVNCTLIPSVEFSRLIISPVFHCFGINLLQTCCSTS